MFFSLAPFDQSEVDPVPSCPPPQVLEAMHRADQAYERLHETGRELRFRLDPLSGVAIELLDTASLERCLLTPHQALQVASGGGISPLADAG
jgi:hypothetical protein